MVSWLTYFSDHFKDKQLLRLLILLSLAALFIITINYYTIKILSSTRAYINGESQYSKGEKDATQDLILLLETEDNQYWKSFLSNIAIPQGDSLARESLLMLAREEQIQSGFLSGNNHPDDINNMIWLFRNFKDGSIMKDPIQIWKEADSLIYQKFLIGKKIQRLIDHPADQVLDKNKLVREILENSKQLTLKERAFSDNLGQTSRVLGNYLLYFNIIVTLLIFLLTKIYLTFILNTLKQRNSELQNTNNELDKFVYSASHDLRAPISSLKGLVSISKQEEDKDVLQSYLDMMSQTLDKQDQFIKDIIDYSLNKKREIESVTVNLNTLIDSTISEHLFMPGAHEVLISKDLAVPEIYSDPKRLTIIFNNLISNAFKYQDFSKADRIIKIKTRADKKSLYIEFEDNGIGIPQKNLKHIFEMFYVVNTNTKGSGLGLYITKEAINKLGGEIFLSSRINFGTKFTIRFPNPK